jgi:muramoyltetrapeptide carboxypeptidase
MLIAGVPAGSVIAVVAPAGPVAAAELAEVSALFERYGYRARIYPGCHLQCAGPAGAGMDYLAGDDSARVADLHAALADPTVAAIYSVRGGYGCMRLLPHLDAALVKRAGKLLVGYSDITALHGLWFREGVASLHAPMPVSDMLKPGRQADTDAAFTSLQRGFASGQVLAPPLQPAAGLGLGGVAEGPLIGGNLSLVASVLGTPWAWQAQGAVLFLEDINEDLYRIDRLITQLRLAGVLQAISGIVLGSFTEANPPHALLRELLVPVLRQSGKPLLAGWPTGHGSPNQPLPLGVRVRLDSTAGSVTLL